MTLDKKICVSLIVQTLQRIQERIDYHRRMVEVLEKEIDGMQSMIAAIEEMQDYIRCEKCQDHQLEKPN